MTGIEQQVQVLYEGEVQGVGFRYAVRKLANQLGVQGGVENLPDGSVHLVAEGPGQRLQQMLLQIRVSHVGPHIRAEKVTWGPARGLGGFYYR